MSRNQQSVISNGQFSLVNIYSGLFRIVEDNKSKVGVIVGDTNHSYLENEFSKINAVISYFDSSVPIIGNKPSDEVARIRNSSLDFVYINDNYKGSNFQQDLVLWYPKVRVGGIISGSNYSSLSTPEVKAVVDRFFSRFSWKINTDKDGFWWIKTKALNISYIIPAYNCESTIKESVKSIYKTNFRDGDELIIVNDKSTDTTSEVLNQIKANFKSVRIINHRYNKGGGGARNTAVENSKNELIFCLDSDNVLAEKSISPLKTNLILTMSDACAFSEIHFFISNIKTLNHTWEFSNLIYDSNNYLSSTQVPGSSGNYLYTKDSWVKAGRYSEDSYMLDTWSFGLRQVMSGSKIAILPNSHYYHRMGYDSYWVRESKSRNMSIEALTHILHYYSRLSERDKKYLLSKKGETWLDNVSNRPIIFKTKGTKKQYSALPISVSYLKNILSLVK